MNFKYRNFHFRYNFNFGTDTSTFGIIGMQNLENFRNSERTIFQYLSQKTFVRPQTRILECQKDGNIFIVPECWSRRLKDERFFHCTRKTNFGAPNKKIFVIVLQSSLLLIRTLSCTIHKTSRKFVLF